MRSLWALPPEVPATFAAFLAGVHRDDRDQLNAAMQKAVRATDMYQRNECHVIGLHNGIERSILIEGRTFLGDDQIIRMIGVADDVSVRRADETRQVLALHELEHRLCNVFSMVNAVLSLSARTVETREQLVNVVQARLGAMERAHRLEGAAQPGGATLLSQVIQTQLAPLSEFAGHIRMRGLAIELGPKQATAVSLIVHELVTNAVKHGAFSCPTGKLLVEWSIKNSCHAHHLVLHWKERGGPHVTRPTRSGFGSRLLTWCARTDLEGDIWFDYQADGLLATLIAPVPTPSENHTAFVSPYDRPDT